MIRPFPLRKASSRPVAAAAQQQQQRAPQPWRRRHYTTAPASSSGRGGGGGNTDARPQHQQQTSTTTHFGFRDVPTAAKAPLVRGVFSSVAPAYDLMNDAMSLGVHRLWKDAFVRALDPGGQRRRRSADEGEEEAGTRCIDVAGGTGDVALRILDWARATHADRALRVDVVDINPAMLAEGRRRFRRTMYHNTPQVAFHEGDAEVLPRAAFPDDTYDLYTIAFGIRNCTDIPAVLREAHRVLKPGGTFACLEFSQVNNPALAQLYDAYSFSVIPLLGTILAGDRASYEYLVQSIRRFPSKQDFADMIADAGFDTGGDAWRDLWGGIVCMHTGVKI